MKKINFFLAALMALSLAACSGQNEPSSGNEETKTTEKILKGRFSVAKDHTVRFAQGNLQYNGGAWQFANEQFIYYGYQNAFSWGESTNHDLFAFGQTGYSNTTMTSLTSTDPATYGGYDQYKLKREDIDGTNWDWGVYCSISNGGNHPGIWRTLTADEWKYLCLERDNAEKLLVPARVAGKRGYLILPDNWSCPGGIAKPNFESSFTVGDNTYCYEDWLKLEDAGAVFLPCAGVQDKSNAPRMPEMCGYYWTSSIGNTEKDLKATQAVHFGYQIDKQSWDTLGLVEVPFYYRCAVRLVQEID